MRTINIAAATAAGIFLLSLMFSAHPLAASGAREEPEKRGVRTEERSRIIEVIMVHREPGSAPGVGVPRPGGQAAWYLFQPVVFDGGTVRLTANRSFSAPVQSRKQLSIQQPLQATMFTVKLTPEERQSYRPVTEVRVDFQLSELITGDRVILQPAQKAVLQALSDRGTGEALVRVMSLSLEDGSRFTARVEIARAAKQ